MPNDSAGLRRWTKLSKSPSAPRASGRARRFLEEKCRRSPPCSSRAPAPRAATCQVVLKLFLPSFYFLHPSLLLLALSLVIPLLSLSLSFAPCAAVEYKLKTLGLWQRTKSPSFSWTPVASEALQVAIDAAGANVQEVVALFLKSPSAEGCNKEGDAGVLPALIFILVPLPPSLALSCESH